MQLWDDHSQSVRRGARLGAFALTSTPWLARAQGAGEGAVIGAASLPRDLSPLGMYLSADSVVKAVLLCLVFASVVTWTVWLGKTIEIVLAKRRVRAALDTLGALRSAPEAVEFFRNTKGEVSEFVDAASLELQMSADLLDRDGVKERVASRLERIEAARGRRILRGTSALATIGATAAMVSDGRRFGGVFSGVFGDGGCRIDSLNHPSSSFPHPSPAGTGGCEVQFGLSLGQRMRMWK